MKAGVEASNLWDIRHPLADSFDGRKVVGLMEWGKRNELVKVD
jgi:hypothetical protein